MRRGKRPGLAGLQPPEASSALLAHLPGSLLAEEKAERWPASWSPSDLLPFPRARTCQALCLRFTLREPTSLAVGSPRPRELCLQQGVLCSQRVQGHALMLPALRGSLLPWTLLLQYFPASSILAPLHHPFVKICRTLEASARATSLRRSVTGFAAQPGSPHHLQTRSRWISSSYFRAAVFVCNGEGVPCLRAGPGILRIENCAWVRGGPSH